MSSQVPLRDVPGRPALGTRRDAVRNYHRILDAARDVLG